MESSMLKFNLKSETLTHFSGHNNPFALDCFDSLQCCSFCRQTISKSNGENAGAKFGGQIVCHYQTKGKFLKVRRFYRLFQQVHAIKKVFLMGQQVGQNLEVMGTYVDDICQKFVCFMYASWCMHDITLLLYYKSCQYILLFNFLDYFSKPEDFSSKSRVVLELCPSQRNLLASCQKVYLFVYES